MLSIVIPLYNKSRSIVNTINSVLNQSYQDFEIVVVDDGSTDGSAEAVRAIADNRIRLFQKENGGVCSARNRGIQEAKGEYIALLDADDVWDKDYLLEQKRLIEDFPEAALWGINFAPTIHGEIVETFATGLPQGFRGIVEDYFGLASRGRVSDLFCSSSVVIRRIVLEEVGLFDERIKYAEDLDMWFRIIARYKVVFWDRIMTFYQHDAENRALEKSIPLDKYLPFFVDKFSLYKDCQIFYKFIHNWSAVKIKRYYKNKSSREVAIIASKRLDFTVLPPKYRKIFCSSYSRGLVNYYFYESLHSIKKALNHCL